MLKKKICFVFVSHLYFLMIGNGLADNRDLFTSTFQMSELFRTEVEFVSLLKNYSLSNDFLSDTIKTYLNKVYKKFDPDVSSVDYVAHPLNSLSIMKRLGFDYHQNIGPLIRENSNKSEGLAKISTLGESFPTAMEYDDACGSLSLLQEAYNLSIPDLIAGKIASKEPLSGKRLEYESSFKLSWVEMFQIGATTCNRGWYDTGISWFDEAIKSAPKKFGSKEEVEQYKILKYQRRKAIQMHDHYLDKRGAKSKKARTFPVPFDEKMRKKKKYKNLTMNMQDKVMKVQPLFNYSIELPDFSDNFYLLCKDGKIESRTPDMDSKFRCRFHHHANPFFKLGPIKLEEISDIPFIVVFHDILSEKEIILLKSTASKALSRSEFGGTVAKTTTGNLRTSKQAWLPDRYFIQDKLSKSRFILTTDSGLPFDFPSMNYDKHINIIEKWLYDISVRIERVTKLSVLGPYSSEVYQVANYGIGGQYDSHVDASDTQWKAETEKRTEKETIYHNAFGDRVATFMGYLEDIPLGGATAFPMIGSVVQPVKGSAVFWINLKPNGRLDRITGHGGCPVLFGSKWITNKWIGGYDQWKYLNCGLSRTDVVDLFQRWRASG